MDINKGDKASYEWERITFRQDVPESEENKVRDDLEEYCKLDTLAEFEIIEGLKSEVSRDRE